MKRVLLLCLISFVGYSQTKKEAEAAAAPKAPATPITKAAPRAAKYEVLYGSKPLSKADQKELNEFVASCDASFPSRAEAVTFFAERAWEYIASARLDTAAHRFNLISALDANSVDVYWGLGVISFQRGDNDLAIRLLNKGLELDSTQSMLRVDYAIVKLSCYEKGQDCGTLDEVEAELKHALQQEPTNANALMKRSQVAYYKENYELAWTYFHEARMADILQLDLNFGSLLAAKMPDPKGIFPFCSTMGIRSFFAKPLAARVVNKYRLSQQQAFERQDFWLKQMVAKAEKTLFGRGHSFSKIKNYLDYRSNVPIFEYEDIKPYIDEVVSGKEDILWPGKPAYFAKTSGTTSGVKYIPISSDSMPFHITAARDALLHYVFYSGNASFLDRKLIFLSGSPEMNETNGVPTGRLSGIVNHHVPGYLRGNQMPTYQTNCIEDWEQKLEAIVQETISKRMGLISGIPPWVQMYFDRLEELSGQKIGDLFPDFQVFVTGGVNFEPYREKLLASIGREIDVVETYPASEGFIAFDDSSGEPGLLLNVDGGIFFEFVPTDTYFGANPVRLSLTEVSLDVNYALLLTTNAGLWSYSIGDTVKFVSLNPYRIVVTGRIKHFISAFGEHVIAEEVEKALAAGLAACPETRVVEFTVAPQVSPASGLPYHEWLIEFSSPPSSLSAFQEALDASMCAQNIYYRDLITGSILRPLVLTSLPAGAFISYMKSQGKLGGQNKVPRLSNDRVLAEGLLAI